MDANFKQTSGMTIRMLMSAEQESCSSAAAPGQML